MIINNNTPTFFEIITAMAFQHLSDSSVDFAVIEVGLGGRFDATNIIVPIVSVITNISLEHTDRLGEDVKSIAFEKGGIIKENIGVVTAVKDEAKNVIEKIAKEKNSEIIYIVRKNWNRISYDINNQVFQIFGLLNNYKVKTSMLGKYQGENIAVAIKTVEYLQMKGIF